MVEIDLQKDQIVIYQISDNQIELRVRVKAESIWLSQKMMGKLFAVEGNTITYHLEEIYKSNELQRSSTTRKIRVVQKEGSRSVDRKINFYNLDAIISVGYRVNSRQATKFRIWATSVLKKYLVQGYALNENKLFQTQEKFIQLQKTISFLVSKSQKEVLLGKENVVLSLLQQYSKSLTFLEQFDKNNLPKRKGKKPEFVLKIKEAEKIVLELKQELIKKGEATSLFGQSRGNLFTAIIGNIYQTFDGLDLYSSIESKAAHLLYFIIKDHPFADGNKRSASFLFIYFLNKNNYLFDSSGERKINNTALISLALLVAESDPKEKKIMIRLIENLLV